MCEVDGQAKGEDEVATFGRSTTKKVKVVKKKIHQKLMALSVNLVSNQITTLSEKWLMYQMKR